MRSKRCHVKCDDSDALQQVVHNKRELARLRFVFRKRPRSAFLHIEVRRFGNRAHRHRSTGEIDFAHALVVRLVQALDRRAQRIRRIAQLGGHLGHLGIEVLLRHVGHARNQVAPGVGQIGVVHLHHALHGDVAVVAELHIAHEVVAVGVHTEDLDEVGRHDAVAL